MRANDGNPVKSPTDPGQIRNVVLVGPSGAGKSRMFEQLQTGPTTKQGRDDRDTTTGLSLAAIGLDKGVVLNLMDTPGHPDFVGDVRAGLRAADAALFVVSAADGVDEPTRLLWEECRAVNMPRAVVVSKLEEARADWDATVAMCQRVLGDAQPVCLPVVENDDLVGVLDLVEPRFTGADGKIRELQGDEVDLVEEARSALLESVIEASENEELMELYLEGEEISLDSILEDVRTAVRTARFFPVFPVHTPSGVGVPQLERMFIHGFPSPLDSPLPTITTPGGDDFGEVSCDPGGPLVAEVIRTTTDPYVGRLSVVRVFSGTLRPDDQVHVSGHLSEFAGRAVGHGDHDLDSERVGPLSIPVVTENQSMPLAVAGDVAVVSKMANVETADTLSSRERPALVEPWVLPEPLLPIAIRAAKKGDEDKLAVALGRLVAEDVTMRMEQNAETHQVVLWTMGQAHIDGLVRRLADQFHVQVETEPLRTAMRETFVRKVKATGRLVKQSGGHGQYAVCQVEIEPLERGAGFEFVDKVVGGAVPRQFIPSVEKGVRAQMEKGVLLGYPMVDVRVTLFDGKAHSVDSSDMAFQNAGAAALKEAANASTVTLLEPVDEVAITVADEYLGAVMADLSGRRAQVLGTDTGELQGYSVVKAAVPAAELSRYPIDLRSVAHGTGSFTRSFARYDYLPAQLAAEMAKDA
ncbi:MAG: elongation factor G-like protein EF-G2 [Propionibacteriaceae bacterium]|nr:elongation factor G-like protein EF-G2 [Propionibacteriaceae bacterium]